MARYSFSLRVLIATLRDFGLYPCPRCLVNKLNIPKLGLDEDVEFRRDRARVDDEERRKKVQDAWNLIYCQSQNIDSIFMEQLLKDQSLIPTQVRAFEQQSVHI